MGRDANVGGWGVYRYMLMQEKAVRRGNGRGEESLRASRAGLLRKLLLQENRAVWSGPVGTRDSSTKSEKSKSRPFG